ncbi:MAG: LPXTG cell wall anchor domain-containing protein [Oscillospiraceae bacterium]|nr:LPXTG cell wall anchor domain-containing protein [Oscillospiraceae bacterium]
MKSKTSCINAAVFRSSFGRFWPLWAIYLFLWMLLVPVHISNDRLNILSDPSRGEYAILSLGVYGGVALGAVMAIAAAMAVWSFLYFSRSAHGVAVLPLRRETVWTSALLGGLVPALAVHLLVALSGALVGGLIGWSCFPVMLQWCGVVSLIYFFFYAFACFCAQLTGSLIILPLVYGVLNFLAVGAELLTRGLLSQFVYGMPEPGLSNVALRWLSPVAGYVSTLRVDYGYLDQKVGLYGTQALWYYAAAGLVLLAGALLLYRRRRMESAGDVVAIRVLKPVFRWCMALGAGLLLGSVFYFFLMAWNSQPERDALVVSILIPMLLGAVLGWFAAEMLIRKSFRVFTGRTWAGAGLVCALILAAMLGIRYDLFGYERHIPAAQDVENVLISSPYHTLLSSEEGIEQVRALHQSLLDERDYHTDPENGAHNVIYCTLDYELRGGGHLTREYRLYVPDAGSRPELEALEALLNSPEAIASRNEDLSGVKPANIESGWVDTVMTVRACAEAEGYDAPEDYLLREYLGLSAVEQAKLSESEREDALRTAVEQIRDSWSYGFGPYIMPPPVDETPYDELDYDRIYAHHNVPLSRGDAWELLRTAVLPDLEEGKLGLVFVKDSAAHAGAVYEATVCIELKPGDEPDGPAAVPVYNWAVTAGATRTVAWLEAHGIDLYTAAEARGMD